MCEGEVLEGDGTAMSSTLRGGVNGRLLHLKTTLELRASDSVVNVYVTRVPPKAANFVLNRLRSFPGLGSTDLQHLRRIVTAEGLPVHLCPLLGEPSQFHSVHGPDKGAQELFLLIAPTHIVDLQVLEECLLSTSLWRKEDLPAIHTIAVPLLAPTSQEQATSWSLSHWPTIYKKNNPFGPHPSIVSRAESEMQNEVSTWMSMAARAALCSQREGHGEPIGAVIVERNGRFSRAVALAGDGRWIRGEQGRKGPGNVMAHAVLRGIAMVARKLKKSNQETISDLDDSLRDFEDDDIFLEMPISQEEEEVSRINQSSLDGYLCHNLEIYLTHEPCVMCSMAILHSRFGRVVFSQRAPSTGALCSEVAPQETSPSYLGLGYGLFWRKELNWCLMAWQQCPAEVSGALEVVGANIHA